MFRIKNRHYLDNNNLANKPNNVNNSIIASVSLYPI